MAALGVTLLGDSNWVNLSWLLRLFTNADHAKGLSRYSEKPSLVTRQYGAGEVSLHVHVVSGIHISPIDGATTFEQVRASTNQR